MLRLLAAVPLLLAAGCRVEEPPAAPAVPPTESVSQTAAAPSAADAVRGALGVGDRAPDFVLPDASGRPVRLSDRLAEGPVVLTFYRGAWCPYCNTQLREYQDAAGDVSSAGATFVAISPQVPDSSLTTRERNGLSFPVLSDVGNRVSRDYGLVFQVDEETRDRYRAAGIDLEASNGTDAWELPVPATYVIAPDGTVRAAFVEADYTRRAATRDVLDALRQLG